MLQCFDLSFHVILVLLCSDLAEDFCCFEEKNYMLTQNAIEFYQGIIGNWSYLAKQLQPKPILKVLLKNKLITEKIQGETIMLDIENQNIFILLLFLQKSSSIHVRLFESLLKKQSVNLQRITVKRWSKIDEAKCKGKHDLVQEILATTNLKDFLNYCFENFVFSPEDYENVVKDNIESLTTEVYCNLTKGSIDCLKTFLEETIRKHETPELSNKLEELKQKLPPAIFVDFTTSPMSFLTTKSEATEKNRWKNYRIQFSLFRIGESNIPLMSSIRMLTCSKWFIQEIAMFPDPNTIVDSSIDLVPLVADAFYRLNKSISTKSLTNLLELYLCGEDIIKELSTNMRVQVSMQVETGSKSNIVKNNDDETVSPDFLDNSSLLKRQRAFLKKEIQPQPVLDALPKIYKQLFKDIDLENGLREDHAEQILDIIAKNEDRNKLSHCFLKVFKRDHPHIYRRLKSIKDAYSEKSSNIIRNMIRTFVHLTNIKLESDAFQNVYDEQHLFEDDIFQPSDEVYIGEHVMMKVLVRIIQKGNKAIGAYIEVLYNNKYDDRIDMLLSKDEKYADFSEAIEIVQVANWKNIELQANLRVF